MCPLEKFKLHMCFTLSFYWTALTYNLDEIEQAKQKPMRETDKC